MNSTILKLTGGFGRQNLRELLICLKADGQENASTVQTAAIVRRVPGKDVTGWSAWLTHSVHNQCTQPMYTTSVQYQQLSSSTH
ncbi:hypothetical protein EYF80_056318 [Liparis tanakae]|uniref:Uncharacterized protein n=1 Tax=Liparis tanakae TaxID=230148 RepID=A0A4Z2EY21_9TELE|nr:hypothetical protein EYF80_056318 [Liparis tanakae]